MYLPLIESFLCASAIYGSIEVYAHGYILNNLLDWKNKKISSENCIKRLSKVKFPFLAGNDARRIISKIQQYTI